VSLAPLLDALNVYGPSEVVAILRFLQPFPLTGRFTGLAAGGLAAKFLVFGVAGIRKE
jgi:hypothetical protein